MNNLELTKQEISQIKELIYDRIDIVGGFDNLEQSLKTLLKKLQS
jgi:hypothetical protein